MNGGIITVSGMGAVIMSTAPVWMTKFEIADLFEMFSYDVRKTIHAIYKNKELNEADTMRYISQSDGISYDVYSLEMVIAVTFRIYSKESIIFRRFVANEICTTKKETQVTLFVPCGRGNNRWCSRGPSRQPLVSDPWM